MIVDKANTQKKSEECTQQLRQEFWLQHVNQDDDEAATEKLWQVVAKN